MFNILITSHGILRYFILVVLVIVLIKSYAGWLGRKSYTKWDNKLSLYLLIFSHIQLLVGIALYFVSPLVQFGENTMKEPTLRYFAVEHLTGMLGAIVIITVARSSSKRLIDPVARHKRMAILNTIAAFIIFVVLAVKGLIFVGQY